MFFSPPEKILQRGVCGVFHFIVFLVETLAKTVKKNCSHTKRVDSLFQVLWLVATSLFQRFFSGLVERTSNSFKGLFLVTSCDLQEKLHCHNLVGFLVGQ